MPWYEARRYLRCTLNAVMGDSYTTNTLHHRDLTNTWISHVIRLIERNQMKWTLPRSVTVAANDALIVASAESCLFKAWCLSSQNLSTLGGYPLHQWTRVVTITPLRYLSLTEEEPVSECPALQVLTQSTKCRVGWTETSPTSSFSALQLSSREERMREEENGRGRGGEAREGFECEELRRRGYLKWEGIMRV